MPARRRTLVAAALAFALPALSGPVPSTASPDAPRLASHAAPPNVIVILTDDQRASGTLQVMPKTRRWFARGGTRYPQAFATTPTCCPSRASIFTGQYTHNHDVHTNKEAGRIDQDRTVQRYLREAGYQTGYIGKFLNGWPAHWNPQHFDRWAVMSPSKYKGATFNINGSIRKVGKYSTDFIGRRASSWIRAFERSAAPWLLYVAPYAPHGPYTPQRKYRKSLESDWPGNPATKEADRSDKPPYVQARPLRERELNKLRKKQLRTLRSVDDMVERIFQRLRRTGQLSRTLVFFASDHGYMWGEHGLKGKTHAYIPSIRMPLLARWPEELPQGAVDPRLAANIDIPATILDAAGVVPGPDVPIDGRSLLAPPARTRILTEAWPENHVSPWASILTGEIHYVEYYDEATGEIEFREYYDLRTDPWELENLLGDADPGNDPPPGELAALSLQVRRDLVCEGTTGENACP